MKRIGVPSSVAIKRYEYPNRQTPIEPGKRSRCDSYDLRGDGNPDGELSFHGPGATSVRGPFSKLEPGHGSRGGWRRGGLGPDEQRDHGRQFCAKHNLNVVEKRWRRLLHQP